MIWKIILIGYVLNIISIFFEFKKHQNATGEDAMGQSLMIILSICPYLVFVGNIIQFFVDKVREWKTK